MAVSSPSPGLVERERELEELRLLLLGARAGEGSIVLIEAPAGHGKTALVRALRDEAAALGLGVLHAVGAELERGFSFGVVRQLLEGAVHAAGPERRAAIFAGAARLAEPVLQSGDTPDLDDDPSFGRLHGLYWVLANLADEQPMAVVVDDAHWADAPSMRFLGVLARRLEGMPVLLAVATRPGEPGAEEDVLDELAAGPSARVLTPQPLSRDGVERVLARALGDDAEAAFVDAAADATRGNPLLVRELVRTIEEEGLTGVADEVERLRKALPGVGRIVVGRLRRLSADALALARAVAVLGDGARPVDAAALADLTPARASEARAVLSRLGFLRPDGLGFVHPVVREGIRTDLVGTDREDWHRRAAALRSAAGADVDEIAAHLLLAEPAGAPWAAQALAASGRRALLAGGPEAAVQLLRRALAEPPPAAERPSVLLALGQAEARTGAAEALGHLGLAAELGDAPLAVQADRLRAQVLLLHERAGESVDVLRRAIEDARGQDPALVAELENDLVDVLAHHEPLRAEYLRHLETGAADDRPTLLAHLAFTRAITGGQAPEVLALARRAFASRDADGRSRMHFYAFEALMIVEAAAESQAALRDATALAQREGSRVVAGPLTYMPSSWAAWERSFGDLRRAEEQARDGLELVAAARAPAVVVTLRSTLAAVLLDRGRTDEAATELALLPAREAGPGLKETHAIRARLRLAEGRHAEALAELEVEFELERRRGWAISNRDPSRATLVAVLRALGRHEEAAAAAEAEVASAERRMVPGAQARARLSRALTLAAPDALDELQAAAAVARCSPSRLIQAQALVELGSALRRAGDRVRAREPLAAARELAHACGATDLERRAHEELVVAGAKPRRIALSGTDSLTAAERRVAELAAQGVRNREIAETLFVSLKTVEVHLSRVYGKLGIRSRSQLGDALAR